MDGKLAHKQNNMKTNEQLLIEEVKELREMIQEIAGILGDLIKRLNE